MKKILWLVVLLFLIGVVWGDSLYQNDFLEVQLDVGGELELLSEGGGAEVEEVKVDLALYPMDSYRQRLLEWESKGEVRDEKVVFKWNDGELGKKEYGFSALVRTENERVKVKEMAHFPIYSITGQEEYLEATENVDKDNPAIVAQATEIVEGEDDLFKAAFKLAKWVEENIEYDLNTLTEDASQPASWVLENRQGVCDEMSSLFMAMCRAVGIPAKFVSGISYTTSDLFEENWLPHGWTEVYFPDRGWVSFDIAFGEYGYVDVTHIKLREGKDAQESSTKFQWKAYNVDLEAKKLNFSVEIVGKGSVIGEGILLREEILGKEVEIGSYNIVKGIVENQEDFYGATTLRLGVPKEVEVISEDKRIVLLEPGEVTEVFWLVKVSNELSSDYWYEFPIVVYSEKNISVRDSFKAQSGGVYYSREEGEQLMVEDEDKQYSRKVSFECDYKKELELGERSEVNCILKNRGNTNLREVDFCLDGICKVVDLKINQEEELTIKVEGKEVGWQKLIVSAESPEIEKKISLEYVVLDDPVAVLEIEEPEVVAYGEKMKLKLTVKKNSFATPENLVIILEGDGFENRWELEELREEEEFLFETGSEKMGKKNNYQIRLTWEDKEGNKFESEEEVLVNVEGKTVGEKLRLWFNGIINFLI